MDAIERLTSLFERFPGIGPRQAGRFVQFLLRSSPAFREELLNSMQSLNKSVHQCPTCYRYFSGGEKTCAICTNPKRDKTLLMVVATDTDFAAMEKSGTYRGLYFVLGGTLSLVSDKAHNLRTKQLKAIIPPRIEQGLKEIILAFPANPEGDATLTHTKEELASLKESRSLNITALGRGLSTGSELEYADPETLKSALESRR